MQQNLKETIAKLEGKEYLKILEDLFTDDFERGAKFLERSESIKVGNFSFNITNQYVQIIFNGFNDGDDREIIFHSNYGINKMLVGNVSEEIYETLLEQVNANILEWHLNEILVEQIEEDTLARYNDDRFLLDLYDHLKELKRMNSEKLEFTFIVKLNDSDLDEIEENELVFSYEVDPVVIENHDEEYDEFLIYTVGDELLNDFLNNNNIATRYFDENYADDTDACINLLNEIATSRYPKIKIGKQMGMFIFDEDLWL